MAITINKSGVMKRLTIDAGMITSAENVFWVNPYIGQPFSNYMTDTNTEALIYQIGLEYEPYACMIRSYKTTSATTLDDTSVFNNARRHSKCGTQELDFLRNGETRNATSLGITAAGQINNVFSTTAYANPSTSNGGSFSGVCYGFALIDSIFSIYLHVFDVNHNKQSYGLGNTSPFTTFHIVFYK